MRVVIFRIDKIGDLIVSTPVFSAIKAKYPEAKIMVVASPYNAVVLEDLSEVDHIVIYDKSAPLKQKLKVLKTIRRFQPSHALVLSPRNDCYFLAVLSGARQRAGIVSEYRFLPRLLAPILLTYHQFVPRLGKRPHQTEAALSLARRLGIAAEGNFPYRLARHEKAQAEARALLQKNGIAPPFIAVHLSDKWVDTWRPAHLIDFLKRVQKIFNMKVVATSGPLDKQLSRAVSGAFPVLSGLPFVVWASVLDQARCVIAPDNAPVHIACALEKPLLALYISGNAEAALSEFGPRGTRAITRILGDPQKDIPLFIEDVRTLLTS